MTKDINPVVEMIKAMKAKEEFEKAYMELRNKQKDYIKYYVV